MIIKFLGGGLTWYFRNNSNMFIINYCNNILLDLTLQFL